MRHSLTKFPHSSYFWFLEQNSLIMNPELTVESHIMNPSRLDNLIIKDQPIVPPDSVIKTFSHLKSKNVDLVITQDKDGLSPGSFILRKGDWSKFFLDTWFDPLYRSYNFQKADTHALVRSSSLLQNRTLTNHAGAYCAMASYHFVEACPNSTTSYECIQQRHGGR
jgi:mannan polymerase II complex MNN11 subunit